MEATRGFGPCDSVWLLVISGSGFSVPFVRSLSSAYRIAGSRMHASSSVSGGLEAHNQKTVVEDGRQRGYAPSIGKRTCAGSREGSAMMCARPDDDVIAIYLGP